MTALTWDNVGERFYETGVDQGVLYIPNASGDYGVTAGVPWNGLVSVTESPSGAEANAQYADNMKYLNLYSVEEFSATVEAFTYPDQFNQFDGIVTQNAGVYIGQQPRKTFGLSYRTKLGSDINDDLGYKYHLVYGLKASPSEKAYSTQSDSPEPITFSWEVMSTPVSITGQKPTSILTIDSRKVSSANLLALTNALYGTGSTDARLPLPDEVVSMFAGSAPTPVTVSQLRTAAPTFVDSSGIATITYLAGVTWKLTNAVVSNVTVGPASAGTQATTGTNIAAAGTAVLIRAVPNPGYIIDPLAQTSWTFLRNP
jgi:hypothetical protein